MCFVPAHMWTYRPEIEVNLLERRLTKMGLMSEQKAFAALSTDYIGMLVEALPLYSSERK